MFFEDAKIEDVDQEIQIEELEKYAKERGIPFYAEDNSSIWNVFANYAAEQEGLNDVERASFGYLCSSFLGGLGYSCGTELYLEEEKLEYVCINSLNDFNKMRISEEQKVNLFFKFLMNLYKVGLEPYYKKTRSLNIRLNERQYEKFMRVPGENKTEKFLTLLRDFEI